MEYLSRKRRDIKQNLRVCVCVYICMCVCMYMSIYIYIYTQRVPKKCIHILRDIYVKCVNIFLAPSVYMYIYIYTYVKVGRDSSVGVATRYGLKGPGIESRSS